MPLVKIAVVLVILSALGALAAAILGKSTVGNAFAGFGVILGMVTAVVRRGT